MGGNFEFNVDVSSVACGCVAGAYAVKIEGDCNPYIGQASKSPDCQTIDIL